MGTESMPAAQGIEAGIDRTPDVTKAGTYLELVHSWIVTVDHKRLGILYICYALVFLLVAGVEALLIRAQLFYPHNDLISPFTFNRLFTMHGTTMVFLVGMPILFGFGNYLVPLMIGARDMAFPRLNAFSFWISAFAGLLLYYSFIGGVGLAGTGSAPDVAWFAYAPLTERAFSPGHTVDYWAVALLASGIGSIGTAINIHRDGILHALQGDDAVSHAAAAVAVRDGLIPCAGSGESADRVPGDAFDRSLPGWPLLRYAGGRVGDFVGALLLDLRASGGLRAGAAGVRVCQRDHPGVFAEGDLWISGDGVGVGGDCVHQPERVGTSHVHDRHDVVRECVLHAVDDAGCRFRRGSRPSTGWRRSGAARFVLLRRCCFRWRFYSSL